MGSPSGSSICVGVLSRFWLFVTPWTAASQAAKIPWNFPSKSVGVGCHFLLQGIFPTQGTATHISCISCIDRWILYHHATWEAHYFVYICANESCGTCLDLHCPPCTCRWQRKDIRISSGYVLIHSYPRSISFIVLMAFLLLHLIKEITTWLTFEVH